MLNALLNKITGKAQRQNEADQQLLLELLACDNRWEEVQVLWNWKREDLLKPRLLDLLDTDARYVGIDLGDIGTITVVLHDSAKSIHLPIEILGLYMMALEERDGTERAAPKIAEQGLLPVLKYLAATQQ